MSLIAIMAIITNMSIMIIVSIVDSRLGYPDLGVAGWAVAATDVDGADKVKI